MATGSYGKCFHCFGKIVINHTCERVPYITHDFHRKMWEAVRRILVEGQNDCQYFPLKISKVLFTGCLFGERSLTFKMFQHSFKYYVSKSEASIYQAVCLIAFNNNNNTNNNNNGTYIALISKTHGVSQYQTYCLNLLIVTPFYWRTLRAREHVTHARYF